MTQIGLGMLRQTPASGSPSPKPMTQYTGSGSVIDRCVLAPSALPMTGTFGRGVS
jgi:hypothetical protein